jgi:hypothetical protein
VDGRRVPQRAMMDAFFRHGGSFARSHVCAASMEHRTG